MPIRLKRPDGSVTPYKNAEYIPAYLFLPAAILDRCPQELHLPRTVASYFHDWNVISTVESDLFIELIMDGFAHLVWPYLGVSGYMENYSAAMILCISSLTARPSGCRRCRMKGLSPRSKT